jgi:hypothetical protein
MTPRTQARTGPRSSEGDARGDAWTGRRDAALALDVVEALSRRFIELTEEHKVGYDAWMITNGSPWPLGLQAVVGTI